MKVPKKLLEVEGLKIYYRVGKKYVKAVDGVSFFIRERETLGLVGESGCGKSTLGFGIMKLLPPGALMKGRMIFQGKNLLELDDEEFRKLRGSKVSMIFQDPMTSLNPIMKIKDHFEETIRTHLPN
ncbi:MAG TPA: ABC transporter ATP-binding protein, partial [Thermotogales bacterium]|nr:ABC transporter ATP-binding protein [Thermotogales bacterium]